MKNMTNQVSNLANKLDNQIGQFGLRLTALNDINVLLGHLNEDMESASIKGEKHLYFNEHHRTVRVLADLMYYTIESLNKTYEEMEKTNKGLFCKVVHPEEEKGSAIKFSEG